MCGIGGIVRFDRPASVQAPRLRRLMKAQRHRGPDGSGEALHTWAALGHTRLALLDLLGGRQPLVSPDGRYTLVYNGEVYNHEALRAELDWTFRTRSDAETVLAAWVRWGAASLERLNGMFSFFVWDEALEEGFAARDRLGVKPLAYAFDGTELSFASEAKALRSSAPHPPRAHLPSVLETLVAPYFSGLEHSPFAGVKYLPPGHWLRFNREGLVLQRWWDWRPRPASDASDAELVETLREALLAAVPATLVADTNVGMFLSGGLDSSALAAVAARTGWRGPAFTVDFEGRAAFDFSRSGMVLSDDLPFATQAARILELELHRVAVPSSSLAESLRTLSLHNDALPAWEQELAQHHLARAAARHVKAVLVGDAADETHHGYRFQQHPDVVPETLVEELGGFPVHPSHREFAAGIAARHREVAEVEGFGWGTPLERAEAMGYLVVRRWLPRLLHNGDIHTMAAGLEARVPFADLGLLSAAASVGAARALERKPGKWLLREALRGLLPESLRLRPKSALPKDLGAQVTYQQEAHKWLRDPVPLARELVDLPAVALLARAPVLTERERGQLFRFICLSHWALQHEVTSP